MAYLCICVFSSSNVISILGHFHVHDNKDTSKGDNSSDLDDTFEITCVLCDE